MAETGMHEHIGEQLINLEIGGKEKVQAQGIVQINANAAEHPGGRKHQYINYQQIFCYRWQSEHILYVLS